MEQNIKNRQAEQLWRRYKMVVEEFLQKKYPKNFTVDFKLPNTEISSSIINFLFDDFVDNVKKNGYNTLTNGMLSSFSFDRILKQGISGTTKNQTLNMFACYLGFKGFEDFVDKNPLPEVKTKRKAKRVNYKVLSWILLGVIIILVSSFAFFHTTKYSKKVNRLLSEEKENKVFRFVKDALEEEFSTYRKLPVIDTTALKKYYSDSCDTYWPGIIRVTNVHHNLNLIITNPDNAATYSVDSIYVSKVKGDTIVVNTIEFWLLPWYSSTKKQYDSTRRIMTDFGNSYTIVQKGTNMRIIDYKTQVLRRRR